MFNDFKNLNFSTTKQKIRKLKELFDRLRLNDFEERLKRLTLSINHVDKKIIDVPPPPPPPPPPTTLPDLAITSLIPTVGSNSVSFEITITNNGLGTSSGTMLNGNLYGQTLHSVPVPSLEPSGQFTTNIEFTFDSEGESVIRTFFAEVNPSHNFIEVDYGNNTASTVVTIKEAFIPDPEKAYLIVHAHNPEGKEINGLLTHINYDDAYIYMDGNPYTYAPVNISQHGQRHDATNYVGTHTFTLRFNGMESEGQIVNIQLGTTQELVFTIPRTDAPLNYNWAGTLTRYMPQDFYYPFPQNPPPGYPTPTLPPLSITYIINKYQTDPGTFTANVILNYDDFFLMLDTSCSPSVYYGMYVYSNLGYLGPAQPISVPSQAFDHWFSQSLLIGDYPRVYMRGTDPNPNIRGRNGIYHTETPLYEIIEVPANISYSYLLFNYYPDPSAVGYGGGTLTLSGELIGGLKLSSVPYDLQGTAF